MAVPFIGEIKIVSFNFPPKGWAFCNGQLLPINQNQALFSLLGTTYGGDGRVNFALPDLRARVPIHMGDGFAIGQVGGEVAHTLQISELPPHLHTVIGSSNAASTANPAGAFWAATASPAYAPAPSVPMSSGAVASAGGSQAHYNYSPFLVLNFCISLQGIFPSQAG